MDAKSFLIGAVCGAILLAITNWFFQGDNASSRTQVSEKDVPAQIDTQVVPPSPEGTRSPQASRPDFASLAETDGELPETPVLSHDNSDRQSLDRADAGSNVDPRLQRAVESFDQPTVERELSGRETEWMNNLQSVLEEEPKDDAWAYYMEQAILQFLANHPATPQFEISYIECRTTLCQIQAIGYDDSTGPAWQQVLHDMRHQPWHEFGETGSSSGTLDGRFAIITTMHRWQEGN